MSIPNASLTGESRDLGGALPGVFNAAPSQGARTVSCTECRSVVTWSPQQLVHNLLVTLCVRAQRRGLAMGKDTIQIHGLPGRVGAFELIAELLRRYVLHGLLHGSGHGRVVVELAAAASGAARRLVIGRRSGVVGAAR
jgi:hypothetical protein